jgi:hypothetical protein
LCDHWHIAVATSQYANELEAESWQNLPDLENRFYIDECSVLWTVALKRPIFNQKKGFQAIS